MRWYCMVWVVCRWQKKMFLSKEENNVKHFERCCNMLQWLVNSLVIPPTPLNEGHQGSWNRDTNSSLPVATIYAYHESVTARWTSGGGWTWKHAPKTSTFQRTLHLTAPLHISLKHYPLSGPSPTLSLALWQTMTNQRQAVPGATRLLLSNRDWSIATHLLQEV